MFDLSHPEVLKAIEFARPFHEEAEPGYFDDHVMAVVREVALRTDDLTTIIATVFHDLFEDTKATIADALNAGFSFRAIAIAEALTDAEGKNRKERKVKTYFKIRLFREAILIKLCDRLDNLRRCMRDAERRFAKMYVDEDYSFRCGLWSPDFPEVWDEYGAMIGILSPKR